MRASAEPGPTRVPVGVGIASTRRMDRKTAKERDVAAIEHELSRENHPDNPVVQELRRQVGNALVLYTNYKHYHWQTFGPLFRDYHKLFDELAEEVLETIDELAERIRMIGQDPPAHLLDAANLASVASSESPATMREMVEEADRNALIVISEFRKGARLADEHDDPGTVDLFSKTVQVHEKHEWFLRDILRRDDGLCT